jgi:hypothetical protein
VEYLGVDGSIILKQTLETGWEGMGWINLSHDTGKWRVLGNTIIDLRVP